MKSDRALRLFLRLAALIVAAVEGISIQGEVGQDVLLNCSCPGRLKNEFVNWQVNEDYRQVVYYKTDIKTDPRYQGRVHLFLPEDNDNCSILLSNVTVADEGTYRCSYHDPHYDYQDITLTVFALYRVCMEQDLISEQAAGEEREFLCQASGGYPKGKIHWYHDDKRLRNTSPGEVPSHRNQSTGLYELSSTMTFQPSDPSGTHDPRCVVEVPGRPLQRGASCRPPTEKNPVVSPSRLAMAVGSSVPVCLLVLVVAPAVGVLVWRKRRTRRPSEPAGDQTETTRLSENARHTVCEELLPPYP